MATTAIGVQAKSELDELYRAHAAEVFRYVYAVLGNRADAEDVTQTTFVNALRALERGERPRKPANWLITIAHNLIRQRFRQQQTRPSHVELDRDVPILEADDANPSLNDLVRALQRIPESQREALVLREMEGRSYKEIAAILGVTRTALEGLIFRARRSLAEELENLVTCDRAELALSRQADGRIGRKERKRLVAHLRECPSCTRVAALAIKRRRAFKGLALLPLPLSLTLFKGAPSASAAVGLPTIGAGAAGGTAAGVAGGGIAAKVAIGFAAVAVASGAGYEGVQAVRDPAAPVRPAKAAPVDQVESEPVILVKATPVVATAKPLVEKPRAKKAQPVKAARATTPVKGRRSAVPGHTKAAKQTIEAKQKPAPREKPAPGEKAAASKKAALKEQAAPKEKAAAAGNVGPQRKLAPEPKAAKRPEPKLTPGERKRSEKAAEVPARGPKAEKQR